MQGEGAKSENWQQVKDDSKSLTCEELIITNTFINSKNGQIADIFLNSEINASVQQKQIINKIQWPDNGAEDQQMLISAIIPYEEYIKPTKISTTKSYIKSCLKVFSNF